MQKKSLTDLIYDSGCSVGAIAAALNIPEKTVVDWCAGRNTPSTGKAIALAEVLGCDLSSLYVAILRT